MRGVLLHSREKDAWLQTTSMRDENGVVHAVCGNNVQTWASCCDSCDSCDNGRMRTVLKNWHRHRNEALTCVRCIALAGHGHDDRLVFP